MKRDMRRPEGRQVESYEHQGRNFNVGIYVVGSKTPEGYVARLDKILVTEGYPTTVHYTVLGIKPLKSVPDNIAFIRPATFAEFRWNKSGFGKTPWFQYWIIVSVFLTIGIGAALSMELYRWTFPLFFALVYGMVELKTYHNFTRKTV